jgi:hypothetical protein
MALSLSSDKSLGGKRPNHWERRALRRLANAVFTPHLRPRLHSPATPHSSPGLYGCPPRPVNGYPLQSPTDSSGRLPSRPAYPRASEAQHPRAADHGRSPRRRRPHLRLQNLRHPGLAASRPQEPAHDAYRLYERFRPDIPTGKKGWGAKGDLDLGLIGWLAKEKT